MNRLFGRKKQVEQGPTLQETSNMLGDRSSNLDKQINELNVKIAKISRDLKNPANRARQATLKNQAMQLLKRRKMLEQQQFRLEGQRFNLDQAAFTQDQIQVTIQTVNQMKMSNQVMKKQMKQISVEGVDDVMFDMEEMLEDANEVSDLLAQGVGNQIDDAELEAELEGLGDMEDFSMEGIEAPATNNELEDSPQITF